ncbi:MAG: hypothetical protein E7G14_13975, partial [Klebsiella michiganensis]|nr:hypothetical protein [Klebsiella michiganensis]
AASRLALCLAGLQVSSRLHAVARTRRVKRRLREAARNVISAVFPARAALSRATGSALSAGR